jgi:hypothetical protein
MATLGAILWNLLTWLLSLPSPAGRHAQRERRARRRDAGRGLTGRSAMQIDWGAFGEVFLVSLGAAVGVIVVFAIGVALVSTRAPAGGSGPRHRRRPTGPRPGCASWPARRPWRTACTS